MKFLKYLRLLKSLLYQESVRQNERLLMQKSWPGVVLQDNIQFVGEYNNVQIGLGSKINREAYLNAGGKGYGQNGEIKIGRNTVIGSKTTLFAGGGSIEIGDNCDIGVGVFIIAHNVKTNFISNKNSLTEKFEYFKLVIEDDCRFGSGSIIIGNSSLGKRCVVSSGSVVSGVYGDDLLLMGNPARPFPKFNSGI